MSKAFMKNFLRFKELGRPPFMPLISSFAAKLEQISTKTMLTNPAKLAKSTQAIQQLLGYDVIFNIIDSTLEAEACGCQISWDDEGEMPRVVSHPLEEGIKIDRLPPATDTEKKGRIPAVLEATKRLQIVMGNKVDIIGALTGPLALSEHLGGETFIKNLTNNIEEAFELISYSNRIITHLCKLYCENKVDGILVSDSLISKLNPEILKIIRPFYRTLFNVISYFDIYFIILIGSPSIEAAENILEFEANGFIVSGFVQIDKIASLAARKNRYLGFGIPKSVLMASTDHLRETVKNLIQIKERGFFLATEGQVPYATPIENMHELMNIILSPLK